MALFRLERRSGVYSVDTIVLTFFIYSLLGWVCEVVYCSVPKRRFVNRGFLFGPYLPIYGFGATFVIVLLEPYRSSWPLVFILGILITSALEYVTSFALEKIFKVKLWDYSTYPLNINGRVCALNSTLFGIMGIVTVRIAEPIVADIIAAIPSAVLVPLSHFIVAAVSVDTSLSVMKMIHFRQGLALIREKRKDIEERTKALVAAGKKELAEELRARLEEDLQKYRDRFLLKASHVARSNPSMSARNEEIRRQIEVIAAWSRERAALRRRQKAEVAELDREKLDELRGDRK